LLTQHNLTGGVSDGLVTVLLEVGAGEAVSEPGSIGGNGAFKDYIGQVNFVDEDVYCTHRIGGADGIVVEALGM
jgi:hypothetical protein